jgi:hypothetical protein
MTCRYDFGPRKRKSLIVSNRVSHLLFDSKILGPALKIGFVHGRMCLFVVNVRGYLTSLAAKKEAGTSQPRCNVGMIAIAVSAR